MKVFAQVLLLSAVLAPAYGLYIPVVGLSIEKRTNNQNNRGNSKVSQSANSGNYVHSSGNGGKASNGDTKAKGGYFGDAFAVPIAKAGGGDTKVKSGDASNANSGSNSRNRNSKVSQQADTGNWVSSEHNGGNAKNGDTNAKGGWFGGAVAVPIAKADGGDTWVSSGDAHNSNEKRTNNQNQGNSKVKQSASSGNHVVSEHNGGKASNGDTKAKGGFFGDAFAVPIAKAGGGDTKVSSGDASNSNKNSGSTYRDSKVKQDASSGNKVWSSGNGGNAKNGDTKAKGGYYGGDAFAVPIAKADGGDTWVSSGDAHNSNEKRTNNDNNRKNSNVKQSGSSGNSVHSSNNGGKARNGDTYSNGGLIGVAVPIAIADGGDTIVDSGNVKNSNKAQQGGARNSKVKQSGSSGNRVVSTNNGGKASNGRTSSQGGLIGVAVPIAVAGGGDTDVDSGDVHNSSE